MTVYEKLHQFDTHDNPIIRGTVQKAILYADYLKDKQITEDQYNDLLLDLKHTVSLLDLSEEAEVKHDLAQLVDQLITMGPTIFTL